MSNSGRYSTGILGLDRIINGGFPPGSRIVILGLPLSGLDLLARQFWDAGGRTGTYLMLDTAPGRDMTDARGMNREEFVGAMRGDQIVVDSLSTLILEWGVDAAIDLILEDTREIVEGGASIVYLLYVDIHAQIELAQVMRAADVVIILRRHTHSNEIGWTLSVEKIRGESAPWRLVPYYISGDDIEISTTIRIA